MPFRRKGSQGNEPDMIRLIQRVASLRSEVEITAH
jgi:hypothetical protein